MTYTFPFPCNPTLYENWGEGPKVHWTDATPGCKRLYSRPSPSTRFPDVDEGTPGRHRNEDKRDSKSHWSPVSGSLLSTTVSKEFRGCKDTEGLKIQQSMTP